MKRNHERKLKNVYLCVEDGTWVSPIVLKCIRPEFVRRNVGRYGMPPSISDALAFLIKRGYIEMRPTRAGREFANRFMKLYEQREKKQADVTKVRRQMRYTALRGTFCLDKITPSETSNDPNVDIYGHYRDVVVKVNSVRRFVELEKGHVVSYAFAGKLYDKIMTDISTTLMSPKGKLRLLEVGVSQLKWFVNWYRSHKTIR